MTVLERLRGLNNHGCAYVTEDQSDRLCPCEMRLWQHLPTLLALAEAVKAVRDEESDSTWKAMLAALADLEKEAV